MGLACCIQIHNETRLGDHLSFCSMEAWRTLRIGEKQIPALSREHRVITIDSRGHGRSTQDVRSLSYELLTDDVIGLMDHLHIPQADFVGWSDGAIVALDAAIHHPKRVRRVFSFAANTRADGSIPNGEKSPDFTRYALRTEGEYRNSPRRRETTSAS